MTTALHNGSSNGRAKRENVRMNRIEVFKAAHWLEQTSTDSGQ